MRIIQNGYNYADSSQNYHEFLICTHKYHPFHKTSESGRNHPPSCLGKYIIVNVRMCTKLCMLRTKFVATNCNAALIFGSIHFWIVLCCRSGGADGNIPLGHSHECARYSSFFWYSGISAESSLILFINGGRKPLTALYKA